MQIRALTEVFNEKSIQVKPILINTRYAIFEHFLSAPRRMDGHHRRREVRPHQRHHMAQ